MKKGGNWYSRGNSKGFAVVVEGLLLLLALDLGGFRVVVVAVESEEGEGVAVAVVVRPGVGVEVADCIVCRLRGCRGVS